MPSSSLKTRADQADMRQSALIPDQHGRLWDCTLDSTPKAKLAWCAPPIPKFSAPWMPPQSILRPVEGNFNQIFIDYDVLLLEIEQQARLWRQQLQAYAMKHYQGQMVSEVLRNPPADLIAMVGVAPPPVDFVRAARAGNKWVLGLVNPKTGMKFATPPWALDKLHWLAPPKVLYEHDAELYPDVEDEEGGEEIIPTFDPEIRADQEKYLDIEDALVGDDTPTQEPVRAPRGGRPRNAGHSSKES